jgi:hypothetical protein
MLLCAHEVSVDDWLCSTASPSAPFVALLCRCIVCIYPAAMVIVTGILSLSFLLGLCIVSGKLAATTINR